MTLMRRTHPDRSRQGPAPRVDPSLDADEVSDAELVARALAEPVRPAFRALYERYEGEVYGFLRRLLGDPSLAEDALQETFMNVHRGLVSFDPARAFKPWLFRIARNAGLNTLRARRKSAPLEHELEGDGESPSARLKAAELSEQVRDALDLLDDEDRALLILRHVLDTRVAALAETYGIGERALRKRLRRAGERLAQALLKTGGAQ
ncbi:MAG: sigma-70 family RNA polymerase sigma factor [Planctomycetes bacterium]|nr:sigma-70 family RNA polymerase sigma factor [Planctomycetota bacterium]